MLKVSLEPFLQKCQRYCRLCAVMLCLKYLQNYCQFQILLVLFFIRHMKRQQQVKLLRQAELFLKKYVFSLYKKNSFCKIVTMKSQAKVIPRRFHMNGNNYRISSTDLIVGLPNLAFFSARGYMINLTMYQ